MSGNSLTYSVLGQFAVGGMANLSSIILGDGVHALLRELHASKILSISQHGNFRFGTKVREMLSPHPNIVNSLGLGYHGIKPYEIIELVEGQNLKSLMNGHSEILQKNLLYIMTEAAEALAWVHRNGFMHLDVKPENFLMKASEQGTPIVKLTDFDLAKRSSDNGPCSQPGTPRYMAPEQFNKKMSYQASDVFAFSLMAYQLVTGKFPFARDTLKKSLHLQADLGYPAKDPRDSDPTLNPNLCAVILKGLSKRREDRYPDMMVMCAELKKKVSCIRV